MDFLGQEDESDDAFVASIGFPTKSRPCHNRRAGGESTSLAGILMQFKSSKSRVGTHLSADEKEQALRVLYTHGRTSSWTISGSPGYASITCKSCMSRVPREHGLADDLRMPVRALDVGIIGKGQSYFSVVAIVCDGLGGG